MDDDMNFTPTRIHLKALAATALLALAGNASAQLDQLQWLEAPHDARALAWARAQTAQTNAALSSKTVYPAVKAELQTALQAGAPLADVILLGQRALRLQKDAAHPHGVLQVAARAKDGAPGAWRPVLDVAALGRKEGKTFELHLQSLTSFAKSCLAPAYRYCLLSLAPAGGDEVELREFDVEAGTFVAGGFSVPAARTQFAWLDRDRVLITHTLGDSPKTSAGWGAAVRMWQRGQPVQSAPIVYQAKAGDALVAIDRLGAGAGALGLINRVIDYSTFELLTVDAAGKATPLALPQQLKSFGALATTDRHIVVQLAQDATIAGQPYPAETVLSYDTDARTAPGQRVQPVYRARIGEFVDIGMGSPLAGLRTDVVFTINRGLQKSVHVATPGAAGWTERDVFAAPPGVTVSFDSADISARDVVLRTQGYLVPAQLRLLRGTAVGPVLAAEPAAFDASGMVAESRQARSKDGTMIDYYLVRPRTVKPGRTTPTLMTGYGAFGISMTPAYFGYDIGGKGAKLWFERGGAIAIPAIRGGGERGEAWHRAAMRAQRQNSYDDFIAVAEDLVQRGFARPAQMGVFGLSNGGLLAATIGLQRPDLFGAVVSDVPLIDMLRFPEMGMGGAWTGEYGDPRDPAMATVLRSYSPLHIARAGVRYPPFLVTVATSDNRVGPGHARKMVARLHELDAKAYLYEDSDGGHGVSDPLSRPELMALRMTFLIDTLMAPAK
jgi:prolyl oligopeptidase